MEEGGWDDDCWERARMEGMAWLIEEGMEKSIALPCIVVDGGVRADM